MVLHNAGIASGDSGEDQSIIKQTLVSAFKDNKVERMKVEMEQPSDCQIHNVLSEDKQFARWSTSWWQQFTVLLRRGVKERKHDSFSSLKIGQVLVVALLTGLLWWKTDISHLQDQVIRFKILFKEYNLLFCLTIINHCKLIYLYMCIPIIKRDNFIYLLYIYCLTNYYISCLPT